MRTIYPTTKPTFYDTKATAKGKWLQQIRNPSSASAGLIARHTGTQARFTDTKLIVLQRVLNVLQ